MSSNYSFSFISYRLKFLFEAGTSRGVLRSKDSYILSVIDNKTGLVIGLGEAGPLPKLSIDDISGFKNKSRSLLSNLVLKSSDFQSENSIYEYVSKEIPKEYPSLKFALETALLGAKNNSKHLVFDNDFSKGKSSTLINGLIWMGSERFMLQQIQEKLDKGFSCLKLKIGSLNFEQECSILRSIRNKYSAQQVELRVDANGAFSPEDALQKLERLSEFEIHSIEQPIRQGQIKKMAELCSLTPIPIALDEELIGVFGKKNKETLLGELKPQFIILKPTLLGGFKETLEWIELANQKNIEWWVTSALESNIGLSAISQFVNCFDLALPQGLGTGQIYSNNFPSPLSLIGERLSYNPNVAWKINLVDVTS